MVVVAQILKGRVNIVLLDKGKETDAIRKALAYGAKLSTKSSGAITSLNISEIYGQICKSYDGKQDKEKTIYINDIYISEALKKLGYKTSYSNDKNLLNIQTKSNID